MYTIARWLPSFACRVISESAVRCGRGRVVALIMSTFNDPTAANIDTSVRINPARATRGFIRFLLLSLSPPPPSLTHTHTLSMVRVLWRASIFLRDHVRFATITPERISDASPSVYFLN